MTEDRLDHLRRAVATEGDGYWEANGKAIAAELLRLLPAAATGYEPELLLPKDKVLEADGRLTPYVIGLAVSRMRVKVRKGLEEVRVTAGDTLVVTYDCKIRTAKD